MKKWRDFFFFPFFSEIGSNLSTFFFLNGYVCRYDIILGLKGHVSRYEIRLNWLFFTYSFQGAIHALALISTIGNQIGDFFLIHWILIILHVVYVRIFVKQLVFALSLTFQIKNGYSPKILKIFHCILPVASLVKTDVSSIDRSIDDRDRDSLGTQTRHGQGTVSIVFLQEIIFLGTLKSDFQLFFYWLWWSTISL